MNPARDVSGFEVTVPLGDLVENHAAAEILASAMVLGRFSAYIKDFDGRFQIRSAAGHNVIFPVSVHPQASYRIFPCEFAG